MKFKLNFKTVMSLIWTLLTTKLRIICHSSDSSTIEMYLNYKMVIELIVFFKTLLFNSLLQYFFYLRVIPLIMTKFLRIRLKGIFMTYATSFIPCWNKLPITARICSLLHDCLKSFQKEKINELPLCNDDIFCVHENIFTREIFCVFLCLL